MKQEPTTPTHLRPDLSEDMYRTEMWLKAGVSPINGHRLITEEQAAHLLAYRQELMASPATARERWSKLHAYATDYLAQLPETERRPRIVRELNESINPMQRFNTNIFLTAAEFSKLHGSDSFNNGWRRNGATTSATHTERIATTARTPKPEKPASQPREPRGKARPRIDGAALDQIWYDFAHSYGITAAQAGAAARKLRTDKPFAPNSVNQQRFMLRTNGVLTPFFQYIHCQPDSFFIALEAQIGKPIATADRQPLLDALDAGFAVVNAAKAR